MLALRAKRWRGRLRVAAEDRSGLVGEFVTLLASEALQAATAAWTGRLEGVTATGA